MSEIVVNAKSDVAAKEAFVAELRYRGFEEVRVTGSPADVTARRGTEVYYFEIKYTAQVSQYFGAATLTEWEAALAHEERYWFVVATNRDGAWAFHEYTPAEFMEFSYIPPFKVFFNVAVGQGKSTLAKRGNKRIQLTRERVVQMVELFKAFRSQ
ncbi:MAG: DUF3883 domain-containing protein [Betaproteobacteria bacterium]|nr:DUF3883 domain-containing protein [Betaproteobacteria bacterium]